MRSLGLNLPQPARPWRRILELWVGPLAVGLFLWTIIYFSLSPFNPDWLAYQSIYENDGAWLVEQGRDPFFLFLINAFKTIFGSDSYVDFRIYIGVYFAVFSGITFRLATANRKNISFIIVFYAILNLVFSRFTIQIREGMAVTFLLIGVYQLLSQTETQRSPLARIVWSLLIFLSCLMHSIIILFVVAFFGLQLFNKIFKNHKNTFPRTRIRTLSFVVFLLIFFLLLKLFDIEGLLQRDIGERSAVEVEIGIGKYLFWLFYGLVSFYVYLKIKKITLSKSENLRLYNGLVFIAGPVTAIIFLLIVLNLATNGSAAIISTLARIYYLALGLSIFYISLKIVKDLIILFIIHFLLIDQIRIISDSIFMHFGMKLLPF